MHHSLLVEGCDDIEVPHVICCSPAEIELHFGLQNKRPAGKSRKLVALGRLCVLLP